MSALLTMVFSIALTGCAETQRTRKALTIIPFENLKSACEPLLRKNRRERSEERHVGRGKPRRRSSSGTTLPKEKTLAPKSEAPKSVATIPKTETMAPRAIKKGALPANLKSLVSKNCAKPASADCLAPKCDDRTCSKLKCKKLHKSSKRTVKPPTKYWIPERISNPGLGGSGWGAGFVR